MAHIHEVIDRDKYFTIDPDTRTITNLSKKVRLMQNDHNSERFTFEIPRYIDDHDMSTCNKVEVHYINTDGVFSNEGIYEVDDLSVSPESDDKVICSWLISQNATQYVGTVVFVVRYACVTGNVIDYQWHTDIHDSIIISQSISNTDMIAVEYEDIIEQWRQRWFDDLGSVVYEYLNDVVINATVKDNVLVVSYGKQL